MPERTGINDDVLHTSMRLEIRALQDQEEPVARLVGLDTVTIPIRIEIPMTAELEARLRGATDDR